MPPAREPHPADGASSADAGTGHGLGPHVVGQRVVVRRLLRGETGPSGGPAMTDLLGVCTAWEPARDGRAGACVVEPESGEPVRIALADIVSGKPVPPRPSVRHRADPVEAQHHGFALFDDLETTPLGAWTLRRSVAHRARRANSCLAFGPSGLSPVDDVAAVLDHYERPVVAVLSGSPEAARFLDLGWVPESGDADTVFQLTGTSRALRAARRRAAGTVADVVLEESRGPRGATAVVRVGEGGEVDGEVVASGVAASDGDWVGFRSIEVSPGHRRRGLAAAVMEALLDWGAEQGATTAYLQVLADNAPALALYERLGFTEHHRYRYLVAPGRA